MCWVSAGTNNLFSELSNLSQFLTIKSQVKIPRPRPSSSCSSSITKEENEEEEDNRGKETCYL